MSTWNDVLCYPYFYLVIMKKIHCLKSVQIRSFFWSVFSFTRTEYGDLRSKYPYSVRIQENTEQKKSPYLDIFHAVVEYKFISPALVFIEFLFSWWRFAFAFSRRLMALELFVLCCKEQNLQVKGGEPFV